MKKKGLLIFLLAAISTLTVSAAACGSNSNNNSGGGGHSSTEHTYGEWEVTIVPQQNTEGKAERTCTEDNAKDSLTLPSLSEGNYVVTNNTATQTTAGTGTYTITINGETVSFTAPTPATGEINYTWTVEAGNKPTQTAEGKATGSAAGAPTAYVTLPALSDSGYTITDDTADVGVEGTGTYTITVTDATYGSVTVSFTAATPAKEVVYETVKTTVNFTDSAISGYSGSGNKTPSEITVGKITFGAGIYVEGSGSGLKVPNGDINTQNTAKAMTFELQGAQNKNAISFVAKGASSGTIHLYKVGENGADDTLIYSAACGSTQTSHTIGYDFTNDVAGEITLSAGTYYIGSTGGSVRLGTLEITEYLEQSDAVSITLSGGTKQFLVGDSFDSTGLTVTLNYANGRKDVLTASQVTVDSSAYNAEQSGVYTVSVRYTDEVKNYDFSAEYPVVVYGVDEIVPYGYSLNSSRVTLPVQKIFLVDGTFNSDNLAVQAKCSVTLTDEQKAAGLEENADFVLKNGITTAVAATTAGVQTVTVSAYEKTATYTVVFVDKAEITDLTTVNVDANVAASGVTEGVLTVKTVTEALQFFKIAGVEDSAQKTVNVAAGTYYEKVEIDLPNVKLVGSNTTAEGVRSEETVIWFDALNGVLDPSGTTEYSTDGSATVSVRAAAENFQAENITFKNYYNTNDLYNQSKLITSNTQAVALLIQSDKAVFKNVTFTSYHDTLYTMYGRHVFDGCYIEGRTDYIFGYNSTSYFNNCTIHSIGAGATENNGGYVVATKGTISGASDAITYGYIFNGCTFEGDENVRPGSVSLARGWAAYMTMVVMNSTLDGSFSKEYFGQVTEGEEDGKNLNDRYTAMNADPNPALLFEYNNTGAGALTYAEGFSGVIENTCTILTAEQAAVYSDFSVIFAAQNGGYTYKDAWTGTLAKAALIVKDGDEDNYNGEVFSGTLLTKDLAESLITKDGMTLEGLYTDAELTTAFVYGTAIDGATTLYARFIPADLTVTVSTSWAVDDYVEVSAGKTEYIGKLVVNGGTSGSFAAHTDASWWTLKGDATATLKLKAGTSVTLSMGYGNTLTVNGNTVADESLEGDTSGAFTYTYTATEDGELVIGQNGSQLYLKSISVSVPLTQITKKYTYTYSNLNSEAQGTAYNASDEYMEMTGATYNGDWLNIQNGSIKLSVVEGSTVTMNVYTSGVPTINGATQTPDENGIVTYTVTETGILTISGGYLKTITVTAPVTATEYVYTYGGDNSSEWSTTSTTTNQSSDSITGIKLESTTDLTLTASGTKATISINGYTTGSSSAQPYVKIEVLDAAGNVLTTLTGTTTASKTSGAFTFDGSTTGSVTTETEFASIKLTCGTSGKHYSVVSATIVVE